jgi:ABC-type multidrug transport system fused ATPase/permease subunit
VKKIVIGIFELYRPFHRPILLLFGFIALTQAVNLIAPYFQGKVIDLLVGDGTIGSVVVFSLGALVLYVFRGSLITYFRGRFELKNLDFVVDEHVSNHTIQKLFGYSLGQHTSENSALKQSVINKGQHSLTALAYMIMYQIVPVVVEVVFLVGALLVFSPQLGLVALVAVVVYGRYVYVINNRFQIDFKKLDKLSHQDNKFRGEVLRNVGVVLVNAQEARSTTECHESMKSVSSFARSVWLRFWNTIVIRNAIASTAKGIILVLGAILVMNGRHTVGEFVMFLVWANWALGNLHDIGHLHKQIAQMYTSLRKYFEMLSIEPDVKVVENPIHPEKFRGDIDFRNVVFSYRRRDQGSIVDVSDEDDECESEGKEVLPALNGVTFSIRAGERIAFVGESGAGKSTVVHALLRAQDPDQGQILIDGHDLRLLDLHKYRASIGLVNQEVTLFDNTLRYNILYGLNGRGPSVTEEELTKVAAMSSIDRFFGRLEKGFDTVIGERGVKLSGGEKQRVGIAQALIKNPDILIFDEATSNLDSQNEHLIRESIEKASHGRTTIIIAHRFSTIRTVDRVIVFDQGKIAGIGTHAELATTCEPYQRLIQHQVF